jgi:hypothetical protein
MPVCSGTPTLGRNMSNCFPDSNTIKKSLVPEFGIVFSDNCGSFTEKSKEEEKVLQPGKMHLEKTLAFFCLSI